MENSKLQKIIHNISFKPKERIDIFCSLKPSEQSEIITKLSKHMQYSLLLSLTNTDVIKVLQELDPDEATDILQILPPHRRKIIIKKLDTELQIDITRLLQFDPNTAGGLMNIDYVLVNDDDQISVALKRLKIHEKRTGRLPAIIVLHDKKITGYLPGHELGFAKPFEKIKKYTRHIQTIDYSKKHDDVIKLFREHPHNKLAVLGENKNVIGIIYSDDVLSVLHEQESKSLYDFAGVSDEEQVQDSAYRKIKFRYKWLIINLGTTFLAAFTVSLFDSTISKYVLLAVYMPIVAGMGGNAATQTLAVLVRGIALGQIKLSNAWLTLRNEMLAGLSEGIINGIIVASIVILLSHDIKIAIILASAMIINMVIAGFFGTLVPLIMHRLNKDPASSATIFITTATDVIGFLSFLGLATLFM